MLFSEIGDIRATLCTIEACAEKRQVLKHLYRISSLVWTVIVRLSGGQK